MAAFAPSVGARFIADDFVLLRSIGRVPNPVWPFGHTDLAGAAGSGHFYRPIWLLANTAVEAVFGQHAVPFHLVNILVFAVIAVEVLFLARSVLSPGRALLAAGVFVVFPRHAESVAWVSGNTDLFAVALGLGALLVGLHALRGRGLLVAAGMAALAALAKEAAFMVPLLAILFVVLRPPRCGWRLPLVLALAQLPVFLVRLPLVGGLGGYGGESVTLRRVGGSLLSYGVGSLTPPQLEVLRHPLLLSLPVLVLALLVAVVWHVRRNARSRWQVARLGIAWWVLAILPVLNLPLDLNTGNGDRLLLLPSVGLALVVGATAPRLATTGRQLVAGAAALVALGLCIWSATDWIRAGDIAQVFSRQGAVLGVQTGRLVLLTVPTAYRTAHVFPDAFDAAIERVAGRPLTVVGCAGLHIRRDDVRPVHLTVQTGGVVRGSTTSAVPFDVSVLGAATGLSPGCNFVRAPHDNAPLGTASNALIHPPLAAHTVYAYFDGASLRVLKRTR